MSHLLVGIAVVAAIAFMVLLYRAVIDPYLQYRYYQQQAKQNPNLRIQVPPRFVPIFGDLFRMLKAIQEKDDHYFLAREAVQNSARVRVGLMGCILHVDILDADLAQELLSTKNWESLGLAKISDLIITPAVPHSIVGMQGKRWQERRKLVTPMFRYQMMKVYGAAFSSIARDLLEHTKTTEKEVNLALMYKRWTISMIGACAFGGAFRKESDVQLTEQACRSLTDLLQEATNYALNPINLIPGLSWFPTPVKYRYQSAIKKCHSVADEVLKRRIEGQKPEIDCERDLLDFLLLYKSETGEPLPAEDIRDECLMFILAGYDTTSNLLMWITVIFHQYPDIEQKCREEVLKVLQSNDSAFPTEADVKSMHFLHACFLETLRLYPPNPALTRECLRPLNLGGLQIQAQTMLRVDTWAIHHSPKYWKDPETFDPHRFLSQDSDGNLIVRHPPDVHSHAWLPFGNGIRNCPGQGFTLLESRIIIAGLLSKFNFAVSPGQKFPENVAITSYPKYGIMGRLIPRSADKKVI